MYIPKNVPKVVLFFVLLWLYYQFPGGLLWSIYPISLRVVSLALGQSYDCWRVWVKLSPWQTMARHNKTWIMCIIIGTKNLETISEMCLHMICLPIPFRVVPLALGQSYDCPSAGEVTLKDMGKAEPITNITKSNKAWIMCLNIGVYCT